MSSNYGLILVVLTFVSGIIWLVDSLTAGKKRKAALKNLYSQDKDPSKEAIEAVTREPLYLDYSKSFFPILLFIVVLRSFLYEPFQIPSASMKPTLTEGDFILVNKYNYGLRLPVTSKKVVEMGLPERGDVAVFRAPHPPHEDYIKRVMGLPGDTVIYTDKKEIFIEPYCAPEKKASGCPERFKIKRKLVAGEKYLDRNPVTEVVHETDRYIETINGKNHQILLNPIVSERRRMYPLSERRYRVPQGHYFMMGDNRDNSSDGRYWTYTNFVPEENLVGEAVSIWMHLDFGIKNKYFSWVPTNIDIQRIGAIE